MSEAITSPFDFVPLAEYPFKDRLMIRLADLVFFAFIKMIGASVRFEIDGWEHFEAIDNARKVPIYAFWHDRIFLSTYFWRNRGIVVLISQSKDGEYIARAIQRLGCGAIRGSSTRGGTKALVEMVRSMRSGNPMAFAVDGPKGPRYVAKLGAVLLAKKTGNPIFPFVVQSRAFWTLKSWDKMQIPRPFSRALTIIGEPIYVNENANDAEVKLKLAELQQCLDDLTERGKKWSGRID